MVPLRRHRLVHVTAPGWAQVLDQPWDTEARAGLGHWAAHGLPLVVTCQTLCAARTAAAAQSVALGLCLPATWGRRRIALQLAPEQLGAWSEFPTLDEAAPQLSAPEAQALHGLAAALAGHGLVARVYGSLGWQGLSGLPYLHAHSDIDLWLAVATVAQADRAAQLLEGLAPTGRRIDGELVFADGSAVAWREWQAWRAGRCRSLLVKHLHGHGLRSDWPEVTGTPCAQTA